MHFTPFAMMHDNAIPNGTQILQFSGHMYSAIELSSSGFRGIGLRGKVVLFV